MAAALTALPCWTRIGGIADGLLTENADSSHPQPTSLAECLLAAWAGPFGSVVLADPLSPATISGYARDAGPHRQRLAAGMAERDPEKAVEAHRLARRHTELRQGLSAGLWRLHLLAGAAGPAAAGQVAGLRARWRMASRTR